MQYIAIAENAHDSCITIANEYKVILHLELERFFNLKRYQIKDINVLSSIISLLIKEYLIEDDIQFIISRFNGETLYSKIIDYISCEYSNSNIFEVAHLDCHAAFCHLSGLKDALVIAYDGGGDYRIHPSEANFLAYHYKNNLLQPLNTTFKPKFDGRVWNIAAAKMFNDIYAAGKVMGIAGYGEFSEKYQDLLLSKEFNHLDEVWHSKKLNKLCEKLDFQDFHDAACFAYTLQEMYTKSLVETLNKYRHYSDNIILVGGCALNVITNSQIGEQLNYENVYIPPCPGDEGQSLGALIYYCGSQGIKMDAAGIPYLGQGIDDSYISEANYKKLTSLILDQKTIAWHMGRSEIGPRALGHRSLLAFPASIEMRKFVSETIKKRESFRPVAPIILEEHASEWFDFKFSSPYMSFSAKAKPRTKELVPGIVHVDGTSRVQTLSQKSNPELYELISRINDISGIPMLMNTSLNRAGLPICNTEQHSKEFYVSTSVDVLNLDGQIYVK